MTSYIFIAKALMFLWCIVTKLFLFIISANDDELSFYLKSSMKNTVYFVIEPTLWNIHIREQYPNCDSIKSFHDTSVFVKKVRYKPVH